mmetsp:Transcript_4511/g.9700  ORF Transcript_4511/g.9700 Transcript_4511/m.9700 type:complete len:634 (-) Transcript_4511:565-2466(-)
MLVATIPTTTIDGDHGTGARFRRGAPDPPKHPDPGAVVGSGNPPGFFEKGAGSPARTGSRSKHENHRAPHDRTHDRTHRRRGRPTTRSGARPLEKGTRRSQTPAPNDGPEVAMPSAGGGTETPKPVPLFWFVPQGNGLGAPPRRRRRHERSSPAVTAPLLPPHRGRDDRGEEMRCESVADEASGPCHRNKQQRQPQLLREPRNEHRGNPHQRERLTEDERAPWFGNHHDATTNKDALRRRRPPRTDQRESRGGCPFANQTEEGFSPDAGLAAPPVVSRSGCLEGSPLPVLSRARTKKHGEGHPPSRSPRSRSSIRRGAQSSRDNPPRSPPKNQPRSRHRATPSVGREGVEDRVAATNSKKEEDPTRIVRAATKDTDKCNKKEDASGASLVSFCKIYETCYCERCFDVSSQWKTNDDDDDDDDDNAVADCEEKRSQQYRAFYPRCSVDRKQRDNRRFCGDCPPLVYARGRSAGARTRCTKTSTEMGIGENGRRLCQIHQRCYCENCTTWEDINPGECYVYSHGGPRLAGDGAEANPTATIATAPTAETTAETIVLSDPRCIVQEFTDGYRESLPWTEEAVVRNAFRIPGDGLVGLRFRDDLGSPFPSHPHGPGAWLAENEQRRDDDVSFAFPFW